MQQYQIAQIRSRDILIQRTSCRGTNTGCLLPSRVGNLPTPNVRSDVWDYVESYTICILLVCRLKIISSPNLKLMISFLVLPLVLLCQHKLLSCVASLRHAQLTSHVYLRLAIRPNAQFANLLYKNNIQAMGIGAAFIQGQGSVLVARISIVVYLEPEVPSFFPTICSTQETKNITTNKLHSRTKFQWFLNKVPRSFFKKLIVSTPLLL